jgi:hypothetical protein
METIDREQPRVPLDADAVVLAEALPPTGRRARSGAVS